MSVIQANEHVFIAGMTQSGKTFLARNYLAPYPQQKFVLDTKGAFKWGEVPDKSKILVDHLSQLPSVTGIYKNVIYRPCREELTFEFYNAFFEYCYYLKNCIVVVDEVMQVCPSPARIPEFYKGILTRGMELGVSVWSLTQRPATIPVAVYSEASHYFIFKLNSVDDRKRLADFTGYKQFMEQIPKQVFWYFNTAEGETPEKGRLVPTK